MTLRLTEIDELTRREHPQLEADDRCCFFGEYTAREGWSFSETNDLISNFKKPIAKKERAKEWRWKESAIKKAATLFRGSIPAKSLKWWTLVPIPPSKVKSHPEYDDRMLRVLNMLGQGLDVRELILQRRSTEAFHESDHRLGLQELIDNYRIDESVAQPPPQEIALFDDVLTNGAHFKAAQAVLQSRYPGVGVVGVFIARRAIVR